MFFLGVWAATPALAWVGDTGRFDALEYVTETQIQGRNGAPMALCHVTRDIRVLGVTLISDIQGYALSENACAPGPSRPFNAEQMETAQALDLVAGDVPLRAANTPLRHLRNYGPLAAVALLAIGLILRRIGPVTMPRFNMATLSRFNPFGAGLPQKRMRRKAAERMLSALCYAGQSAGRLGPRQVALIGRTITRLTGYHYDPDDIAEVFNHVEGPLTEADFIAFGKGLRDKEKDAMMRAVFYVTFSAGRIAPSEDAFLKSMAHGIGMQGADFRRVMTIAMADLDRYPP